MLRFGLFCSMIFITSTLFAMQTSDALAVENNGTSSQPTPIIVAVVDTGIDEQHPAFKGMIVKGKNVLKPEQKPTDDHGHGTMVAGVVMNTYESYKDLVNKPTPIKLMPIKALTKEGDGLEDNIAEGIRHAVAQKAKIIVLSLGLYDQQAILAKAVKEAEQKGIIVVAATGNDGEDVKYPAAYSTVLAVGGADEDNRVISFSNVGEQVDVVAPWTAYTTELGGDYVHNEGTSMAAPQAAAAAALYLSARPSATPLEFRQHVRQTALDIETTGWDPKAGYGMLDIERLLAEPLQQDFYEKNNSFKDAKRLPLGKMILAQMNGPLDRDWFMIQAPNRGVVALELSAKSGYATMLKINTATTGDIPKTYYLSTKQVLLIPVLKGKNIWELSASSGINLPQKYALSNSFTIYRDDFEDNNLQYKAYVLPLRTQTIRATMERAADQDWYVLPIDRKGKLSVKAKSNHIRFDLVMRIRNGSQPMENIDRNGYGEAEMFSSTTVNEGKFFIHLSNADGAAVATGEYQLEIQYTPFQSVTNAVSLKMEQFYFGQLSMTNTNDWYQFSVPHTSLFQLEMDNLSNAASLKFQLLTNAGKSLAWEQNNSSKSTIRAQRSLGKGRYFLKLELRERAAKHKYRLRTSNTKIYHGFIDIEQHWAKDAIVRLKKQKIIRVPTSYRFAPERPLTRASAAVFMARAFPSKTTKKISIKDVKINHWAYDEIKTVVSSGLFKLDENDAFQPERSVTRAEMSMLMARALGLDYGFVVLRPYRDVPASHPAANAISKLKAAKLISGYSSDSFYPSQLATRAQFISLLAKALQR